MIVKVFSFCIFLISVAESFRAPFYNPCEFCKNAARRLDVSRTLLPFPPLSPLGAQSLLPPFSPIHAPSSHPLSLFYPRRSFPQLNQILPPHHLNGFARNRLPNLAQLLGFGELPGFHPRHHKTPCEQAESDGGYESAEDLSDDHVDDGSEDPRRGIGSYFKKKAKQLVQKVIKNKDKIIKSSLNFLLDKGAAPSGDAGAAEPAIQGQPGQGARFLGILPAIQAGMKIIPFITNGAKFIFNELTNRQDEEGNN